VSGVCFVDIETTGLDPDDHEVWEVGLITPVVGATAAEDGWNEQIWQLPVDLSKADPMALNIGRFHDRRLPADSLVPLATFASEFVRDTRGLHLAGAVVSFDAERLWQLLRNNGECPMWHYHIIDVEALAAGWLAGRRHASDYAAKVSESGDCTYVAINTEDGPSSRCRIHPWTDHEFSSDPTGALPPWKSADLSRAVGVNPEDFEKHTALGDARWAKAIYEAVMGT
jgi:hypothetical protein